MPLFELINSTIGYSNSMVLEFCTIPSLTWRFINVCEFTILHFLNHVLNNLAITSIFQMHHFAWFHQDSIVVDLTYKAINECEYSYQLKTLVYSWLNHKYLEVSLYKTTKELFEYIWMQMHALDINFLLGLSPNEIFKL